MAAADTENLRLGHILEFLIFSKDRASLLGKDSFLYLLFDLFTHPWG